MTELNRGYLTVTGAGSPQTRKISRRPSNCSWYPRGGSMLSCSTYSTASTTQSASTCSSTRWLLPTPTVR